MDWVDYRSLFSKKIKNMTFFDLIFLTFLKKIPNTFTRIFSDENFI